jgi:H+/Cl- antiporter ClcA
MPRSIALGRAARSLALAAIVGVVCGAASALFLGLLERATHVRLAHESLVFALPFAGFVIGTLYERYGANVRGGTNLVIDALADGGPQVPPRMAPMVLVGTILTHLFGGSAGREGTAVQMGASLADTLAYRLRLDAEERRELLAAGVAGGFGSVFGTPLAGTVFAMEFVVIGRFQVRLALPALVAASVGDLTTRGLGIVHGAPPAPTSPALDGLTFLNFAWLAVGIALASWAFIELTHAIKHRLTSLVPKLGQRMLVGGLALVVLWRLTGSSDELGLSIPALERALTGESTPPWVFARKLAFTALTLGSGFLGGEVTPLFVIGATMGSALAHPLGLPPALAAAIGMAGLFGASANTPIAVIVMAGELFGFAIVPWAAPVIVLARLLKGRRSIYAAQRTPEPSPDPSGS